MLQTKFPTIPLMSHPGLYSLSATLATGQEVSLADYKGKVLLVVNTATLCGLTYQLTALQALHSQYQAQGFTVLAFPSADFGNQEKAKSEETVCDMQARYSTRFPIFQTAHVRGPQAQPVFAWLTQRALNGRSSIPPVWNFAKYLVSREGQLVQVFSPITSPNAGRVHRAILAELARKPAAVPA